jgi:ketosteroid isomerase-like protein
MPGYDSLPYLVTIMGLHIILYLLHRANEVLQTQKPVTFVLEIISPEKSSVHQLATASFRENNRLTSRAVEAYIDQKIATSAWQDAMNSNDIDAIVSLFSKDFEWDVASKANSKDSIKDLYEEFKERALSRHQKHLEKVHATWGGSSIMLLENWTKICQCRREKWNDAKTETEAIYRRI